jgi:hypothetical protein
MASERDGISLDVMVPSMENMFGFKPLLNAEVNFFNYKGTNSIVLVAIVDHDYCFRYIGANWRNSDGGIFRKCPLCQELENSKLPHGRFLVGEDAFPLKTYLLKLYSHRSDI